MEPYVTEELWRISPKLEPEFDAVKQVLTIPNFFANPEDIYEHLSNRPVPMWKYNPERNSRNGVDYLDCRVVDTVGHPSREYINSLETMKSLCRRYWWKGDYNTSLSGGEQIEINCFKTLSVTDNKFQHYPHIDSDLGCPDSTSTLNLLVYLDKEENGGTAVYGGEWIHNREEQNLLYPVEELFDIEHVIPAKFNTCVIFPGNRLHGAYIDDYNKYKDNWRYSYVKFLAPVQR